MKRLDKWYLVLLLLLSWNCFLFVEWIEVPKVGITFPKDGLMKIIRNMLIHV
jgi:hypothetical protein